MTNLYTLNNIPNRRDIRMVECPKCGHNWDLNFNCLRCGHIWEPKHPNDKPKVCPKCKSPYWNRPRQKNKAKGGV